MESTGITAAITEFFGIMTSGIGKYGQGFASGIAETAKHAFFEVSEAGAITGLNGWGALTAAAAALTLGMTVTMLVFNKI